MEIIEKARAKYKKAKAINRRDEKLSRASKRKVKFSRKKLISEIMFEARVLNRHLGATGIIAEKVADEVEKWASTREIITEDDITRVASKKLAKYDKDLAYIYENRDKIV